MPPSENTTSADPAAGTTADADVRSVVSTGDHTPDFTTLSGPAPRSTVDDPSGFAVVVSTVRPDTTALPEVIACIRASGVVAEEDEGLGALVDGVGVPEVCTVAGAEV